MTGKRTRRICLVTPGHLSTNPRLVKEADALAAAGYEVGVVSARFIQWADEADGEFAGRPWQVRKVAFGPLAGRAVHVAQGLRRRVCEQVYRLAGHCAETAFHPAAPALARATCEIAADLYIAHNLAALPAAHAAARLHGARLGFDAEDFHSGELNDTPENALRLKLTREIERRYLPDCDYLTAASPGIAKACAASYGLKMPTVVLNVFPRADAPPAPTARGSSQPSPSLYWFSQTVGPDRGLETVVEAIALSQSRPYLYLRGNLAPGYREKLSALAEKCSVGGHVRFMPPGAPGDMARSASEYDVGLASETGSTRNRDICLTNKIFVYLLAGMPVMASDTSAQEDIAASMPAAVILYPKRDAAALARRMDDLLLDPVRLPTLREAAWKLGHERYNWDVEKSTFLGQIESVFERSDSVRA